MMGEVPGRDVDEPSGVDEDPGVHDELPPVGAAGVDLAHPSCPGVFSAVGGTRVIYGQPASEVEQAKELLGLSDTEAKLLPNLPRGQALWKVGTRSFLVDHRLSAAEAGLVDTDARMTAAAERVVQPP